MKDIGTVIFIWDYDTALGQINSQLPYNFLFEHLEKEVEFVNYIKKSAIEKNIKMVFATLGFSGESTVKPFENKNQISELSAEGFEIASHSWKHEWTPFLSEQQFEKSLLRTKKVITPLLSSNQEELFGFVPPFSRPMTWLSKGRFSLSDRTIWPIFKNGNMDQVLKTLQKTGYKWCRVAYHPIWRGKPSYNPAKHLKWQQPFFEKGILCLPFNGGGFDTDVIEGLNECIKHKLVYVISGHPSMLSRNGKESKEKFDAIMELLSHHQKQGHIRTITAMDLLREMSDGK
jgi:peptidoglycan/xylan/chitin deacetylase (PgdA/CDA1 family)